VTAPRCGGGKLQPLFSQYIREGIDRVFRDPENIHKNRVNISQDPSCFDTEGSVFSSYRQENAKYYLQKQHSTSMIRQIFSL